MYRFINVKVTAFCELHSFSMILHKNNSQSFLKVQKQIDELKFQVDDLCDHELPSLGPASPDRDAAYKRAELLQNQTIMLQQTVENLNLRDESLPTAAFHAKKVQEQKRLGLMKDRLEAIQKQLEPDEVEQDYFREASSELRPPIRSILKSPDNSFKSALAGSNRKNVSIKDRQVETIEDDQDEGSAHDYDEDEEQNERPDGEEDDVVYHVQALTDFAAEQPDDLTFRKGDVIQITQVSQDGWWTGRNLNGQYGLVPSTLIRVMDVSEVEGLRSEVSRNRAASMSKHTPEAGRSGKELWASLRNTPNQRTGVTDVLKAMKAVPAGFRNTTLGALFTRDEYRASSWVVPKFGLSNLNLRDLFWDKINKRLRPRTVKVSRTISLVSARMIPWPGAGMEVLSRHVYLALWDETRILSNVHVVKAIASEKDPMHWMFTPKIAKFVPSLNDGEVIARMNPSSLSNICLLMELNYYFVRSSTGEKSELCCGWTSLPLFEPDGTPVGNKSHDLAIRGGTPFERGVELDPSVSVQSNQSVLQSIISVNRQPRLLVKTTASNRLSRAHLDLLPDTLVTSRRYSHFISLYREHLAKTYCLEDTVYTDLVCDPLLAGFPRALAMSDIMDALQLEWDDRVRGQLTRAQRRDPGVLQTLFRQCFLEVSYAIMQLAYLPAYKWMDGQQVQSRYAIISEFLQKRRVSTLPMLLAPGYPCRPFITSDIAFDLLSDRSSVAPPVGKDHVKGT